MIAAHGTAQFEHGRLPDVERVQYGVSVSASRLGEAVEPNEARPGVRFRHCGKYRRIKDWRPRLFATRLGQVTVQVPRVISCLCTTEPLDDNDEPAQLRFSECSIEPLLPGRRTPELAYLCAKHGATVSYRCAARNVADLAGAPNPIPRDCPQRDDPMRRVHRG